MQHWDREVDLLVIGAGAAGMTAALVGAIEGLDVLLCEKSEQVGGTTATSAGSVWVPGNHHFPQPSRDQDLNLAREYLQALMPESDGCDRLEHYLQAAPKAIDYLAEHTQLRFMPAGQHPDYVELKGAGLEGRVLGPEPFDGRTLGADFARVRAPIAPFMVLGGMMVGKKDIAPLVGRFRSFKNFIYAAKLLLRHGIDRLAYPRGTRLLMGNALVARLFVSLRERAVPLLFSTSLAQLIVENDCVVGAEIKTPTGMLRIRARRGVVLATGGYGHDRHLRARFINGGDYAPSLAFAGNTGDAMHEALRIGARVSSAMQHGSGAFWTPVSSVPGPEGGYYPHLLLDRAKPGLIAVNSKGRRFVNEGASYHDFVIAMLKESGAAGDAGAAHCHLICDASFVHKYGLGVIHPGASLGPHLRSGYVVSGETLSALATKIGIDARSLQETVADHNRAALAGLDAEFGKGATVLSRFNGDASHKPNPCLAPIENGPFLALRLVAADLATSAGLDTDPHGCVLNLHGQPIAGLYACGNDMTSVFRSTYPGPGTTLGPGITFAYLAARKAAGIPFN